MVIDASAFMAILLDEDLPVTMQAAFEPRPDMLFWVPPLWYWEISNTAVVAVRRARKEWVEMETQLAELFNLPIRVDDQSLREATGSTARLAQQHETTVYDAAYLEIALRRQLPLATLDRRLAGAARAAGVEVIGTPT